MRTLATLFGLLFFTGLSAQIDSSQNCLVWKIYKKGDKDTSYLFGTIHIPTKKVYLPLGDIPTIMEKVNAVYFELDYSSAELASVGQQMLATKPEEQIKNLLSTEQYKKLHEVAKIYIPQHEKVIDLFKPMAILSLISINLFPQDTSLAMDIEYQMVAGKMGKIIGGLETFQEQMDVLINISKEKQIAALVDLIENHEKMKVDSQVLLTAYINQDLATLKKIMDQGFLDASYLSEESFLTKRNHKMLERMILKMKENNCLFGVGAGHLLGNEGLINLLKTKGYQVEKYKK